MEINITKVFERDIDLFFIDEFISNKNFANILLSKVGIFNYNIIKVYHSLSDSKFGESDITIVIEDGKKIKYGILIEDKIDAIAMSNQSARYFERGNKGVKEKEYDHFFVFIIAPNSYLKSNNEATKYPNKVSYEELLYFLEKQNNISLSLKIILFKEALHKKKIGYQVIEDPYITNFWKEYYLYQETFFPNLRLSKQNGPRGSQALWSTYNTDYKRIKIYHKSDKGYIDLTFPEYGEKIGILNEKLKSILDDDMILIKTNQSAAIRIKINSIDFNKDFKSFEEEVYNSMVSVERLEKVLNKINYYDLYYD